jgi:hypothetical protein
LVKEQRAKEQNKESKNSKRYSFPWCLVNEIFWKKNLIFTSHYIKKTIIGKIVSLTVRQQMLI